MDEQKILLDPYLLGCLIGDAYINKCVQLTSADQSIVNECQNLLPEGYLFKKVRDIHFNLVKKENCHNSKVPNIVLNELKRLGLNKKSYNKFIPDCYKYNSIANRLAILQGLMDTDGSCGKDGKFENIFYTSSSLLAEDVKFIVNSLGGTAKISNKQTYYPSHGIKKAGRPSFAVNIKMPNGIKLFRLNRKLIRQKDTTKYHVTRYVDTITYVGKEPAKCILIDSNDHLYATDDCILTHNTLMVLATALELVLNKKEYDKFIIYRPIQAVGNDIGFLPGPQPLTAGILTPSGWTTMGELKLGSKVISRDGSPTDVIGIYPKGIKSVYRISTNDGSSTEACEDHLWQTSTLSEKQLGKVSVKTTKQIMDTLNKGHYLPKNDKIQYENKSKLHIPPYTMGALLGDGSMNDRITIHNTDSELINRINIEINSLGYKLVKNGKMSYRAVSTIDGNQPGRKIKTTNIYTGEEAIYLSMVIAAKKFGVNASSIYKRCSKGHTINGLKFSFIDEDKRWENDIKHHISELGLLGKTCESKFIPDIYKYSSIEDRIDLLRGLMDTDGTIKEFSKGKRTGEASYSTTSKRLALDIIELIKGLGGRAKIRSRDRRGDVIINGVKSHCNHISYEFTVSLPNDINPFYISRKSDRVCFSKNRQERINSVKIEKIEYVGEKEVQCIKVSSPEHLYITDNFIVTHNTMEEKLGPWFQAIMDNFEVLFSNKSGDWKKNLEMYVTKGRIEMEAITYIRGRSIPNAIILVDEAQNLTKEDVKTILTRAGEGTKIILTGDIEQIDNSILDATSNGLTYVIEKFKESEYAGHITFTQGERSRLATEAAEIL